MVLLAVGSRPSNPFSAMNNPPTPAAALFVLLCTVVTIALGAARAAAAPAPPDDGKLRIICFGAHPDDCELQIGGTAALWAAQGHHVKFVSLTNGDIGHWRDAGGPLAVRRRKDVEGAAKILGTHVEIVDVHDGELMPTLENRQKVIRLIREWRPHLVFSHRPWDYHPDHRNTGLLVQDAAYMVTVPFIAPDAPHLKDNPVFMYYTDRFQKPYPSQADVVVPVDSVMDKKLDALAIMESQFLEGGANGHEGLVPKSPEARKQRVAQVRQAHAARNMATAERFRKELAQWVGEEQAKKVRHAEAFEVCEYGRRPTQDELKKLFPFFGEGTQQ
jgi:LmbE family N-acetylglucosaminyl deacetylase